MATDAKKPLRIPTLEELREHVVPLTPSPRSDSKKVPAAAAGKRAHAHDAADTLSPIAERFLRAAAREPRELPLEERWSSLGVTSGSVKKRILDELTGRGFIRLERKGRMRVLHLYKSAFSHLGIKDPKRKGVGGTTHKILAERFSSEFKRRKYVVYVEKEIGTEGKRIDMLALGEKRIGVEIGLSSLRQELKNLREDLKTGVLDLLVFVAVDPKFLARVKRQVKKDTFLHGQLYKIRFLCVSISDDTGDTS